MNTTTNNNQAKIKNNNQAADGDMGNDLEKALLHWAVNWISTTISRQQASLPFLEAGLYQKQVGHL